MSVANSGDYIARHGDVRGGADGGRAVKTSYHQIEIVEANSTGCYRRERAWATAAIRMEWPQQSVLRAVRPSPSQAAFEARVAEMTAL